MAKRRKKIDVTAIDFDKVDKKALSFVKVISILIIVAILGFIGLYSGMYVYINAPIDVQSEEAITFVVNQGEPINTVLERLEKEGLIRSAVVAKLYLRNSEIKTFYAGEYILYKSYSFDEIISELSGITNAKQNVKKVTFIEGKRLTNYAQVIADEFNYSYDDVIREMQDRTLLEMLAKKYWFITDDVLNSDLYYPLEGYLFPDTYEFSESASIKEIISTMVAQTGKVLEPHRETIESSPYGVHGLLTMASMVELEAVNAESRSTVAGIFYNRLAIGKRLGSDVTTYYDVKKEIVPGTLTVSDLQGCQGGYNTSESSTCASGLPVGPMCGLSKMSIEAAINPKDNNYYYFVADSEGTVYYAETYAGHLANISYCKSQGKWLE